MDYRIIETIGGPDDGAVNVCGTTQHHDFEIGADVVDDGGLRYVVDRCEFGTLYLRFVGFAEEGQSMP